MNKNRTANAISEVGGAIMLTVLFALILGSILGLALFQNIDSTGTVTNATGGYINETGYTLSFASETDIAYTNLVILNATDNSTILAGNYTLSAGGILTNATATEYPSILITYDYSYETSATLSGVNINALSATFSAFVVAIFAFVVIGGTLIGILWILPYIKPLFRKEALGMSS